MKHLLDIFLISAVHKIIENLVDPRERKNSRIQDLKFFSEIKNEYQKRKKPQKLKKQKKKLSRKEFKDLGLYSLPRKTLKYEDYKDLNNLWSSYMDQQFGSEIKSLLVKFDPAHPQYEQTTAILHKSDFHGAKLKVTSSKCSSLIGHKGIVLLDTKGTFSIISKDNILRVIPKSDSIFELKWKNARFTVFGKHLSYRSAERSTKKIKTIEICSL